MKELMNTITSEDSSTTYDPVNHPKHYTSHPSGIEIIEVTSWLNFDLGNAVKYFSRFKHKKYPREDFRKGIWYFKHYIEVMQFDTHVTAGLRNYAYYLKATDLRIETLINNLTTLLNYESLESVKSFYSVLIQMIKHSDLVGENDESGPSFELYAMQTDALDKLNSEVDSIPEKL